MAGLENTDSASLYENWLMSDMNFFLDTSSRVEAIEINVAQEFGQEQIAFVSSPVSPSSLSSVSTSRIVLSKEAEEQQNSPQLQSQLLLLSQPQQQQEHVVLTQIKPADSDCQFFPDQNNGNLTPTHATTSTSTSKHSQVKISTDTTTNDDATLDEQKIDIFKDLVSCSSSSSSPLKSKLTPCNLKSVTLEHASSASTSSSSYFSAASSSSQLQIFKFSVEQDDNIFYDKSDYEPINMSSSTPKINNSVSNTTNTNSNGGDTISSKFTPVPILKDSSSHNDEDSLVREISLLLEEKENQNPNPNLEGEEKDVVIMAEREDEEKVFQNNVITQNVVKLVPPPLPPPPLSSRSTSVGTGSGSGKNAQVQLQKNTSRNSSNLTSNQTLNSNQSFIQVPVRQKKIVPIQTLSVNDHDNDHFNKEKDSLINVVNTVPSSETNSSSMLQASPRRCPGPAGETATTEVIRSVNGVTTIEIKPIHHIINLPPKRAKLIQRNRTQFKKSSRLSQFMSSEFKLDAPIAHAFKVHKLSSAVRRKVHGWVRRIQEDPDDRSRTPSSTDFHDENIQGQNEFDDLRRLVKQGGDFCKDLSCVLQERAELESTYSKGLAKLSCKLLKASKEATGSVAHAWQAVAVQMDTQAELHRLWSVALQEECARPLKISTETQHKIRKSVEVLVDKTTRNLAEWRTAEAKAKRQCFSNSKEFEKLQESNTNTEVVRSRLLSVPPSDPIKLESKKRKAEEAVRRADIEYYTFCVRSERARLEWEGSIRNGSTCLRTLEEEKLLLLKELAAKYFNAMNELMPKLTRSTEVLEEPIKVSSVEQDMQTIALKRLVDSEQLLPDFYAEDTSNLMRKERRSEALLKFLFLIKQDLDRERKGVIGVENMMKTITAKAIADAPKIDNTHHDIADKLYYAKLMLLYLEASRLKLDVVLADLESNPKPTSAIIQYMRHQRDKQGLPQTILRVPTWAIDECLTPSTDSPDHHHWNRIEDKNNVDVNNLDTDFDEFSSEAGSSDNVYEDEKDKVPSIGKCRVVYDYDANMFDELTIRTGDLINVHDKQADGWWLGELNHVVGIFPATYVEEITETSE